MNRNELNEFEQRLKKLESDAEKLARDICAVKGGGVTWEWIDQAIWNIRDAIRNTYQIEVDD